MRFFQDLPDFERIRAELNRKLDRVIHERLDVRRSTTSIRSTGSKLVTFEDQHQRKKSSAPIADNTKKDQHRFPSASRYDHSRPAVNQNSDGDATVSNGEESDDGYPRRARPGAISNLVVPPRRASPSGGISDRQEYKPRSSSKPTSGVSALVVEGMKPSTTNNGTTISAIAQPPIVKAKRLTENFSSDR